MKNPKVGDVCAEYTALGRNVVVLEAELPDGLWKAQRRVKCGKDMTIVCHPKQLRRLKPKAKETVWINTYNERMSDFYANKESANHGAGPNRTALLECRVVKRWPVKGEGK